MLSALGQQLTTFGIRMKQPVATVQIISIIFPISMLKNLECLGLSPWILFMDDVILALATTSHTLRELTICSQSRDNLPTLHSLCSLASNCPNLTQFHVRVNTVEIPSNVIPSSHHLETLRIDYGWSTIPRQSLVALAEFIDALFPYLCYFTSGV